MILDKITDIKDGCIVVLHPLSGEVLWSLEQLFKTRHQKHSLGRPRENTHSLDNSSTTIANEHLNQRAFLTPTLAKLTLCCIQRYFKGESETINDSGKGAQDCRLIGFSLPFLQISGVVKPDFTGTPFSYFHCYT